MQQPNIRTLTSRIDQICFKGRRIKPQQISRATTRTTATTTRRRRIEESKEQEWSNSSNHDNNQVSYSSSSCRYCCCFQVKLTDHNRCLVVEYNAVSNDQDDDAAETAAATSSSPLKERTRTTTTITTRSRTTSLSTVLLEMLHLVILREEEEEDQHEQQEQGHVDDPSTTTTTRGRDDTTCSTIDAVCNSHRVFFTREIMDNITSVIMEDCDFYNHNDDEEEEEKEENFGSSSSYLEMMIPFDLLNRLFPNFHGSLTISNCAHLTSSHLDQFLLYDFGRNVSHLCMEHCPRLTCLGFLAKGRLQPTASATATATAVRRIRIHLESLSLSHCGLIASSSLSCCCCCCCCNNNSTTRSSTTWDAAMETWSLTTTSLDIELTICHCPQVQCLPLGILVHLQDKLSVLDLRHLPLLTRLPAEIGLLQHLKIMSIENTGIVHLPPEMGRLNSQQCLVAILDSPISTCTSRMSSGSSCTTTNDKAQDVGVMKSPPKCYRGSIQAMQRYFTRQRIQIWKGWVWLFVLFRRARLRALERLYEPGGRGYKYCRDRFQRSVAMAMAEAVVNSSPHDDMHQEDPCAVVTNKRCKY